MTAVVTEPEKQCDKTRQAVKAGQACDRTILAGRREGGGMSLSPSIPVASLQTLLHSLPDPSWKVTSDRPGQAWKMTILLIPGGGEL